MNDIGLSCPKDYLRDRPLTYQSQKSPTSDLGITPMRKTLEQLAWIVQLASWHTIVRFIEGDTERVCPAKARRDLPTSIQSVLPSRLIVVMDVLAALVEMSAVTGLVEDIL